MTPKTLVILGFSLLLARPALPAGPRLAPPSSGTRGAVALSDAAFRAGGAASRRVFWDGAEDDTDGTVPMQSNRELRTICLSDCERELQQCQSDRRAGVHTQSCSAILDACTDVCWVRWPAPPPPQEGDDTWLYIIGVLGAAALWAILELAEEESY